LIKKTDSCIWAKTDAWHDRATESAGGWCHTSEGMDVLGDSNKYFSLISVRP